MKSIYWRPQKLTGTTMALIGGAAVLALALVELSPRLLTPPYSEEKLAANQLAQFCRHRVRELRKARGLGINRMFDPSGSGLIGTAMTSITSKPGHLASKQLSLHPQLPAAIVQMLRNAGVRNGDTVAVGWTGSFPALNVALASAMEVLELRPLIITSVTASQYGANEPELTWLDMESALSEAGLIPFRSAAATIGGPGDCGKGMGVESIHRITAAMQRNNVPRIAASKLSDSLSERMEFVQRNTNGKVSAYINVGGGVASCGGEDSVFAPGLNREPRQGSVDCMMQRFADQGIPVIHLAHPQRLCRQFGLAESATSGQAMTAAIGSDRAPSRTLAVLTLGLIWFVLHAFILRDTGMKLVYAAVRRLTQRPVFRTIGKQHDAQWMA